MSRQNHEQVSVLGQVGNAGLPRSSKPLSSPGPRSALKTTSGAEMGSFSIAHWLVVLLIVVLIFGTKRVRNLGADLGGVLRGFKDALREGSAKPSELPSSGPATD
jgi:sec-independent protein translocase protein TatA